jgi:hypothetical protein
MTIDKAHQIKGLIGAKINIANVLQMARRWPADVQSISQSVMNE